VFDVRRRDTFSTDARRRDTFSTDAHSCDRDLAFRLESSRPWRPLAPRALLLFSRSNRVSKKLNWLRGRPQGHAIS
jgi:hypothetical protein